MRRNAGILFLLVAAAIIWQLYQLYLQNRVSSEVLSEIEAKTNALNQENLNLQADLNYFSDPNNLEKELKARYNYKKPGEKLIIIVPPKENVASSTSR